MDSPESENHLSVPVPSVMIGKPNLIVMQILKTQNKN